jgi:hypothetical protein
MGLNEHDEVRQKHCHLTERIKETYKSCTMPVYSGKAQSYLDAIAAGVFTSQDVRDWLIKDTPAEVSYVGSGVLIEEQTAVRWYRKPARQPFWANYFCGRDSRCTCRIDNSKALESDAVFFFRNGSKRVLAIHVEFKHRTEAFGFGQPEGYPLRAACFVRTHHERSTVNAHDDWTTVIFCDTQTVIRGFRIFSASPPMMKLQK